jgi:hypothetical protein
VPVSIDPSRSMMRTRTRAGQPTTGQSRRLPRNRSRERNRLMKSR